MTTVKLYRFVAALALAIAMVLGCFGVAGYGSLIPPDTTAREQQERLEEIFSKELLDGERTTYISYTLKGDYSNPYNPKWGYSATEYEDYARRWIGKDDGALVLKTNAVLADFVHLSIEEKAGLTIEEGVTLTVHGKLEIAEGSLVNKGTILVEDGEIVIREKGSWDNAGKLYLGKYETDSKPTGQLRNNGSLSNTGTIKIANGTLDNGIGTVENAGLLWITNQSYYTVGLYNTTMLKDGEMKAGVINNTGNLYIQGYSEQSVFLMPGSTINNQGKIYKTADTVIKGTITGEQPLLWAPKQ